ncbi:hypothetical protein A9G24_02380 [Gilliamella sp. App6-5]|nr:hypothetical protein A9G24_02380 [Gilliamella apicola]
MGTWIVTWKSAIALVTILPINPAISQGWAIKIGIESDFDYDEIGKDLGHKFGRLDAKYDSA